MVPISTPDPLISPIYIIFSPLRSETRRTVSFFNFSVRTTYVENSGTILHGSQLVIKSILVREFASPYKKGDKPLPYAKHVCERVSEKKVT